MNYARTALSLATVASSVLLAGAFVSYRAGAFNSLLEASARPADSGNSLPPGPNLSDDSNQHRGFSEHANDRSTERERTIMSSSKSTTTFSAPLTDTIRLGANTYKVELGSAKTAEPQPSAPPEPPPPKTTEPARTLM